MGVGIGSQGAQRGARWVAGQTDGMRRKGSESKGVFTVSATELDRCFSKPCKDRRGMREGKKRKDAEEGADQREKPAAAAAAAAALADNEVKLLRG